MTEPSPFALDRRLRAPALVCGGPVRLQQILFNLLANAVKFTERGGITLAVTADRAPEGKLRYRFEVTDTGIGLEMGQIDALSGPFMQAEASTARQFGARAGQRPGSSDSPSAQRHGGQALNVLIAEDNPVSQMLIAALVRRLGHDVTMAENGGVAVEKARAGAFDAILMDMQMPELDGLAATRAIRASDGPCAAVPIVALTADASPERRRFYEGAGLSGFLTKPISRSALAACLGEIGASRPVPRPKIFAPSPAATVFEQARIDELRSVLGDARLEGLLALLMAECRERPARLRAEQVRGDLAAVRAEAHSLFGAAGSIGACALGDAAMRLESASDLAAAAPLVEALDEAARDTLGAAQVMLSRFHAQRALALRPME